MFDQNREESICQENLQYAYAKRAVKSDVRCSLDDTATLACPLSSNLAISCPPCSQNASSIVQFSFPCAIALVQFTVHLQYSVRKLHSFKVGVV